MRGKSPNRFQRSQKFSKHYYFMIFFLPNFGLYKSYPP
jgi:hypothetical protein